MLRKTCIAAFTLAAIMVTMVFFAGCGQPAAPGPDAPAEGAQPAPPAAPPPAAPAAPVEEVVIGGAAVVGTVDENVFTGEFTEAPWFQGRGFPPVAERLPDQPRIWNTATSTHLNFQRGRYNSAHNLRTIRMDPVWDALIWTGNEEPMVESPNRLGAEFSPNIILAYDISDDLMTFTFHLRPGMRWSDGHPVTTDDVYFTWNYWVLDHRIHPHTGTWWRGGGDPRGEIARQEIIDRYSWRMIYPEPTGGLIAWMAFSNYHNWLQPAHHARALHIDHQDEAVLRAKVEDHGFLFPDEWHTFFQYHRVDPWNTGRTSHIIYNPGHMIPVGTPSISAWLHYQDGDVRTYQRNPYFWKIDRYGQQLPYICYVTSHLVVNLDAASIRLLAGDIDHGYEWVPLASVPLFMEHAEAGNFRLLTETLLHRTDADIQFNFTYECERWRSVVRDVRFRRAVSRAINRADILEAVYLGFARVSDIQDPTHDFDYAMSLLDEMGLDFAADGFRSPDGDPFIIDITYHAGMAQFGPTAIILNEVMRELGFNTNFRLVDSPFKSQLMYANELMMTVHFMHGPVKAMFEDWQWNRSWRNWHLYWTTGGESGEPIDANVLEFYETVFRQVRQNHPRYIPAARQRMRDLQAEHYLHIIPVEDVVQVTLINNDLRNVPERGFFMLGCWGMDAWWFDR